MERLAFNTPAVTDLKKGFSLQFVPQPPRRHRFPPFPTRILTQDAPHLLSLYRCLFCNTRCDGRGVLHRLRERFCRSRLYSRRRVHQQHRTSSGDHYALGELDSSWGPMEYACFLTCRLHACSPKILVSAVMNKTITPPSGDKHDYMSWAP